MEMIFSISHMFRSQLLDLDLDLDFRSGESHLMACKTPPIYFTFSGSGLILKVSICMKCQIFCSTTFYLV